MFAKSTVMLSIVGASFIMACCVSSSNASYTDYLRRLNADVLEYKRKCGHKSTRCVAEFVFVLLVVH